MSSNPIFGPNRLKLGTFCTNGRASALSTAPEVNKMTWPLSVEVARTAEDLGFEAAVPFARWLGYIKEKPVHYTTDVMETYVWAAAIAQATKRIGVFVTSHAPTIHPLLAANQTAAIDIVSNGRLGFNIVGGWNKHELEMFGAPLREHEGRYAYLAEWIDVIRKLWTQDQPFDHRGEFFNLSGAFMLPKPVQVPHPPIMNAGGSERGKRFACEHADMCFVTVKSEDRDQITAEVAGYKDMAREQFGREVQVWTNAFVVQRDTQREADDFLRYYAVEMQDRESVDAWIASAGAQSQSMPPEAFAALRMRFAAGAGGFPLVGTAERIIDALGLLADCGIDGVLLSWGDYADGLARFGLDVMPELQRIGLREQVA